MTSAPVPHADNYAILGNPVQHSQSPRIHALFAEQTGQSIHYQAIQAEPGCFAETVRAFQRAGGKGLNVTVPFKRKAWETAPHLGARAQRARAVNVLWFETGGSWHGDNVDGIGLLRDLRCNQGARVASSRVLILGAGGAAWGILGPLLDAHPSRVTIANRTMERAHELVTTFADCGPVQACSYPELRGNRFDLVLHATSLGLYGKLPPLPEGLLKPGGLCYDLFYAKEATPFEHWARRQEAARVADGLGMLVEQAAESFLLWRGLRPQTQDVLKLLEQERASLKSL